MTFLKLIFVLTFFVSLPSYSQISTGGRKIPPVNTGTTNLGDEEKQIMWAAFEKKLLTAYEARWNKCYTTPMKFHSVTDLQNHLNISGNVKPPQLNKQQVKYKICDESKDHKSLQVFNCLVDGKKVAVRTKEFINSENLCPQIDPQEKVNQKHCDLLKANFSKLMEENEK